jgi:hypothetical protein
MAENEMDLIAQDILTSFIMDRGLNAKACLSRWMHIHAHAVYKPSRYLEMVRFFRVIDTKN